MLIETFGTPRADIGEAIHEFRGTMQAFIGLRACPTRGVSLKAAKIPVITSESRLKRKDVKRAKGGSYNRIGLEAEDFEYSCVERGLEGPVDDSQKSEVQNQFDLELETAQQVEWNLLMEQEIRVNALLFNTTTWTGSALYTDVSSAPWDAAGSDAIGHIQAAKEKVRKRVGIDPNTLIIGQQQLINLKANTEILNRLRYVGIPTQEMILNALASIFGVAQILVGGGVYDSADEGQTTVIADVWSDDYAMLAVVPLGENASLMTPAVARSFLWTADSPDNVMVEQYVEDQTRSNIMRVRHTTHEAVIDANFAHLLKVDA